MTMSQKAFDTKINALIQNATRTELENLITRLATKVKPEKRELYLRKLERYKNKEELKVNSNIIEDIREFIEDLTNFTENYEPDYEDYHSYEGSEDATQNSEHIFSEYIEQAQKLFKQIDNIVKADNYKLACAAFEKIFELFDVEDNFGNGILPCSINSNFNEVCYRYIWSIYESTPLKNRSKVIYNKIIECQSLLYTNFTLSDIKNSSSKKLSDFDMFLPDWYKFLKNNQENSATKLLIEAALMIGGTSKLKTLANKQGKTKPIIYLKLANSLINEHNFNDAFAILTHSLSLLPAQLPIRKHLCDVLLLCSAKIKHPVNTVDLKWDAFTSKPNIETLIEYQQSVEEDRKEEYEHLMCEAHTYLKNRATKKNIASTDLEAPFLSGSYCNRLEPEENWCDNISPTLLMQSLILAKQFKTAFSKIQKSPAFGWSYSEKPTAFFFSLMLNKFTTSPNTNLNSLLDMYINEYRHNQNNNNIDLIAFYKDFMNKTELPLNGEILAWCKNIAENRVYYILKNTYRGAYKRAGTALFALCEALKAQNKKAEGIALLAKIKNDFPRHSAFIPLVKSFEARY